MPHSIFGWSYPPGCNGTPYDDDDYSEEYEEITKALKALDDGRDHEAFPIVSFGDKDADLLPSGSTGIKEITRIDDVGVSVLVGGYKTFVPSDTDNEEIKSLENEILADAISGYHGDWTGDDWSVWMDKVEVSVEWTLINDGLDINYSATAEKIIQAADAAVLQFQQDMKAAEDILSLLGNDTESK